MAVYKVFIEKALYKELKNIPEKELTENYGIHCRFSKRPTPPRLQKA